MIDLARLNMRRLPAALVAVAALLGMRESRAVLVAIEYYDQGIVNPTYAGGPLWTGYVDTAANTLEIQTWTELPLHGSEYWIPRDLPLVWPARTSTGALYDVPETFNGHIDDTFAFISDLTLRQMGWLEPHFNYATTPPTTLTPTPATFTLSNIEVRPGWGGMAIKSPDPAITQFTFFTANPFRNANNAAFQPLYDERVMPALPIQSTAFIGSTGATISVAYLVTVAVPEAGAWLMVGAALSATLSARWWSRRRQLLATAANS